MPRRVITTPQSKLSRRSFFGAAAGISLGLTGLRRSYGLDGLLPAPVVGFGPLVDDPHGLLALPEGFKYTIISRVGERMDDGFYVPDRHDGMATFPGPDGSTLLVRNHEMSWGAPGRLGPFGSDNGLLRRLDPGTVYDIGGNGEPALGGTTTLLFDTREQRLLGHRLSLAGTLVNCAGGPTPWGSWISCEETSQRVGDGRLEDHGYNFEVPATWDGGVVTPVPLKAMGRFEHEAVAVDPESGIVYQTEDEGDGLIYRLIPNRPGELAAGGRLQALRVLDQPSMDVRNWEEQTVWPGSPLAVGWIDLSDVGSPDADMRLRGFEAGAARFARGEGMWWTQSSVYFACTTGGDARKGQIWRYVPSPYEGTSREAEEPGTLELFIEPNDGTLIENADNLTAAPWGDLIVCEDGYNEDDYLSGVTPAGDIYRLGHNLQGRGEFAGACFSPDGTTLFVNMQIQGLTVAITGPWERGAG
jgi:secreted PhoX family phosphatase